MAYQLQPGLSIVENTGALPGVKATDEVFRLPSAQSLKLWFSPQYHALWNCSIQGW